MDILKGPLDRKLGKNQLRRESVKCILSVFKIYLKTELRILSIVNSSGVSKRALLVLQLKTEPLLMN